MNFLLSIANQVPVTVLLALSATSVIAGDFFGKYWSTNPRPYLFVITLLCYAGSGLLYTPVLLREGLVTSSLVWSLMSTLGFLVIGLAIFKETLTPTQMVAVALGVAALVLLEVGR